MPPFPILGAGKKLKKEITSRIEALGTTLPSPPTDFDFHDFGKMSFYFDLLVKKKFVDESDFEESMPFPFFKTIQVPELGIYSLTIHIQTLVQFIGRKDLFLNSN